MTSLPRRTFLALTASLAACSVLPSGGPAPQLFTLTPAKDFPPDLPSAKAQLLIEVPVAAAGLDTERLALMRGPTMVDYFSGSAWTDRAPLMVQGLLVESFENSGKIAAVARDSLTLRADFVMETDLRQFTALYEATGDIPSASVRLSVRLIRLPERQIVAQRGFEAAQKPAQNAMPAIVTAFDTALHTVMRDIVVWTLPAIGGAAGHV